MTMQRMGAYVERAPDDPSKPIRVTAATEGKKKDGLDLRMDRARLDRWRANPVVLLEHFPITLNADMPAVVGRADSIDVEDDRLRADVTFDTGSAIGAEIDRQYRSGFMHAFSIGFLHGARDDEGVAEWWEPMELSAVPIPLDEQALADDERTQLAAAARFALGDHDAATELRRILQGQRVHPVGGDREAIPPHSTATDTDSEWDGPGEVADAPNDASTLRHMHTWRDPDGDPDEKASYKLPHHTAGSDTPANISGVNNALARLSQSDIPDSDRDAVERHLRDHREDAGLDRGMSRTELAEACASACGSLTRVEPAAWLDDRERRAGRSQYPSRLARARLRLHSA